ncbi:MAG: hypothetical protein RLZZ393_199 [Pseudomonadota bacterium]|jgi:ElaB/YqjD/DUF883 family membrane-anchored ribosome-binding protein
MSEAASVDRLKDDVRQVIADFEALLKATAGQAGDRVDDVRHRAERTLHQARRRLEDLEDDTIDTARKAVGDADRYVRDNPWQSIAVAAGVAFLLGVLVSRR